MAVCWHYHQSCNQQQTCVLVVVWVAFAQTIVDRCVQWRYDLGFVSCLTDDSFNVHDCFLSSDSSLSCWHQSTFLQFLWLRQRRRRAVVIVEAALADVAQRRHIRLRAPRIEVSCVRLLWVVAVFRVRLSRSERRCTGTGFNFNGTLSN